MKEILLTGIEGSNPLGFLAALGSVVVLGRQHPDVRLSWQTSETAWRPILHESPVSRQDLSAHLADLLHDSPATDNVYALDKKLPYPLESFRAHLSDAVAQASLNTRAEVDLLAALGTDAHADNGQFADTTFRMVRSGDSAGQGLLAYAARIKAHTTPETIERTLLQPWDYADDGSSLRWDPLEDQRYALRWYDPSPTANKKFGPRTMLAANCLALEALRLFPVAPVSNRALTTGFRYKARLRQLTWPIWSPPLTLQVIRSALSLKELHNRDDPKRSSLRAMGIEEVFRCDRIAQNQYYSNFSIARPT
jgi:hypothetical protein